MTKLEQARKLLAEATPGPWSWYTPNGFCDCPPSMSPVPHEDYRQCENWVWEDYTSIRNGPGIETGDGAMETPENAALIVAAVNEYAALLDVVEAAKGMIASRHRVLLPFGETKEAHDPALSDALYDAITKWEELV